MRRCPSYQRAPSVSATGKEGGPFQQAPFAETPRVCQISGNTYLFRPVAGWLGRGDISECASAMALIANSLAGEAGGPPQFAALKVAALLDTAIISGPGRQLAALAHAVREHGVEFRIYMFQRAGRPISPYIGYLERAGIDHVVLPDRGRLDVRLVGALARALREWRPDIVQSHNYRTAALAWLLRVGAPWPWIAFFHGATNENWKMRLYNRIDRALLPRADRLVVMSEHHLRSFASIEDRVRLIYNAAIPLPVGGTSVSLAAARLPGVPLVGVVGRLSFEKGIDVLLDAAARCQAARTPISLVVVGEGPEREVLERQAAALGLANHVHFVGNVLNMASLYPQLDLVVLPSRSEGLPNVLLEAVRANVPVVATAVGAVPEVLANPAAGEIAPPEDAGALAGAIGRALARGSTAEAHAARQALVRRFSLSHRVSCHLALYAELRPDRLRGPGYPVTTLPAGTPWCAR
jgi:glycosyltransferase involved in cell wall biosynthesis